MSSMVEDIRVEREGMVAITTICRPPSNYFDAALLTRLAGLWEGLGQDDGVRAIILAAEGKAFCAGNHHAGEPAGGEPSLRPGQTIYAAARRLFAVPKPVVAAVQGAAVGGGMGLALAADFRIVAPEARFWANFSKLGFHAGFGLTATLPHLVGPQMAARLLYTARRIDGAEAVRIGLADEIVEAVDLRDRAMGLASDIATNAPLAVQSMRATLRRDLLAAVDAALEREFSEQAWQRETEDCKEGKAAMAERRDPVFRGR